MELKPPAELEPLLSAIIDGTLTHEQQQRLLEIVSADDECLEFYIEYVGVSAMLEFMHGGLSGGLSSVLWETELAHQVSLVQEVLESEERERRERELAEQVAKFEADEARWKAETARRFAERNDTAGQLFPLPLRIISAAAAAILFFALVLRPDRRPQDLAPGGTLTDQRDARWSTGDVAIGSDLRPGRPLTLAAGFAEITMTSGAIALVEAPASFEILAQANALKLTDGKLAGLCHTDASKGFVVQTKLGDVTDWGTEFGVEVANNSLVATVFTGEITVTPKGGKPRLLTYQQTARVSTNGNEHRLVVQDQVANGFTTRMPREPLVADARINLAGFEVRIVPQGVREDAILFTDRNHELNGIDKNGLPPMLLGGDLVMMPTDARITPGAGDANLSLELELELAGPADILVLYPEHVAPLAWLGSDFERTEMAVGIDRSEGLEGETPGVGPGVSIDGTLRVWRFKSRAAGRVKVAGGIHDAMYAVVVVPTKKGGE